MRRTIIIGLVGLLTLAGCKGTEPTRYGPLKSRITEGREQPAVVAGDTADDAVNLSYREPLTTAEALWQRVLLPGLAYAQGNGVTFRVQPGAVACIREDQSDLVPKTRCVTADTQGNSRFEWLKTPTRAGQYKAKASATYGLEATREDSVTVTIIAGVIDSTLTFNFSPQPSPAAMPAMAVGDKYQNAIPYRIVTDGRLTVSGTTVGSTDARTVTFGTAQLDTGTTANPANWRGPVELRGAGDAPLARAWYHIGIENDVPAIFWRVRGLKLSGP